MLMRREAACRELSLHSRASAAPHLLVAQVAPRLCPGEVQQAEDVKMFSTQKQHKEVALAQSPAATGCAAWCKPTRSPPPFSLFTSSKFVILVK